jgi:isopenicillin N synthase-like dioxygenase
MDNALPVIDISGLFSSRVEDRRTVAAALGAACRGTGFFYVAGHGIAADLVGRVFEAAGRFFAQDRDAKLAVAMRRGPNNRGWFELAEEQLDPNALPDRKEGFNIGLELAPGDPRFAQPFRGENFWPDLPGWRDTMLAYFNQVWSLGTALHRGFSLDLGLDEHFFDDKLDAPLATLRLLRYPPAPDDGADGAPGAGEHTDYGNVTILAVDGVGGLQLRRRDGEWIEAPTVPDAFIVNIGDCLMRWTNDEYVSTPHRVAVPKQERRSIAFFLDPNPDAVVAPVLGGPEAHRRYPPITGAAYLRSRLDPTYKAT